MTVGIRIGNTHGGLLIDDRFHGQALKSTYAAGDVVVTDANGYNYTFGDAPAIGPGVGMRVFSSVDHSVVFDSRNRYIRVVDSFDVILGSTPIVKNYPAGRTYAAGALGWARKITSDNGNPFQQDQVLAATIIQPATSWSGTTLTTGTLSTSDTWPTPAGAAKGDVLVGRLPWRCCVVDVTGCGCPFLTSSTYRVTSNQNITLTWSDANRGRGAPSYTLYGVPPDGITRTVGTTSGLSMQVGITNPGGYRYWVVATDTGGSKQSNTINVIRT